jgi:type I restriction enzyme M protein
MSKTSMRERFVEQLKALGGNAGNGRLREALGWQEETYWRVHEELIAEGAIEAGRGRGGSVVLVSGEPQSPPPDTQKPRAAAKETALRPNDRKASANDVKLGFEEKLWAAADALRNNMDAAEYKHVVLGLIFLKYVSDAFEAKAALA